MAIVIAWISILAMDRMHVACERKRVSGRARRTLGLLPPSLLMAPILAALYVLAPVDRIAAHHVLHGPGVQAAFADVFAERTPAARAASPAAGNTRTSAPQGCRSARGNDCPVPYGYVSPVGY